MNSKKEIADAVAKFIGDDILPDITDMNSRFALCMARKALSRNPDVIDAFLGSPIVASVIREQDGEYDVEPFAKALKGVLAECGSYRIAVPKIPVFSPCGGAVSVTSDDVDRVLSYLRNEPVAETLAR